jgi:hypothetical protein
MRSMLNARTRRSALGGVALLVSILSLSLAAQAVAVTPVAARPGATANQALRVAERAKLIGQRALRRADRATEIAQRARTAIRNLRGRVDAARFSSATAPGTVTTSEENSYVDLGGPSVTVDVPGSGLVEVAASVTFGTPNDGLVALFEDGAQVPLDQPAGICGSATIDEALLSISTDLGEDVTLSTPPSTNFVTGCGTFGSAAGPVVLKTTPGSHTYSLRYADCGCDPADSTFSDRTLRVAGRE